MKIYNRMAHRKWKSIHQPYFSLSSLQQRRGCEVHFSSRMILFPKYKVEVHLWVLVLICILTRWIFSDQLISTTGILRIQPVPLPFALIFILPESTAAKQRTHKTIAHLIRPRGYFSLQVYFAAVLMTALSATVHPSTRDFAWLDIYTTMLGAIHFSRYF